MITDRELAIRVRAGQLIMVGEVRGVDVSAVGFVDKKSGLAEMTILVSYFMERLGDRGYEIVKITHRGPEGITDPALVPITVQKGRTYAFAIESLERKPAFTVARMSKGDPEELGTDASPAAAPSGAAAGDR